MELYLQMGHGMQGLAQELIRFWGSGKAILSPVNFMHPNIESVDALSKKIRSAGGQVLFDPQMFYPKEGHTKLQGYDYWPAEGVSIASENVHQTVNRELLRVIIKLAVRKSFFPA